VECDSYIDAYQLPSCGEMEQKENSVLYAVKTEILVSYICKSKHVSTSEHILSWMIPLSLLLIIMLTWSYMKCTVDNSISNFYNQDFTICWYFPIWFL